MAFDPLSWAFGFVLTSAAKQVGKHFMDEGLGVKLMAVVNEWAAQLDSKEWVHPMALFPDLVDDATISNRPALGRLRLRLEARQLPSASQWEDALVEQWTVIRADLCSDAQPFFTLDNARAQGHLAALAGRLHNTAQENVGLFNATVVAQLDELLSRMGTGAGLPAPIEHLGSLRDLALAVEHETGATIHAIFHERGTSALYAWGAIPGDKLSQAKWSLLAVACALSAFPSISEIVVGPSSIADLPGTDGAGDIGHIRLHFPVDLVKGISQSKKISPGFWENLKVSECVGASTPLEGWRFLSFRQFEDMQ